MPNQQANHYFGGQHAFTIIAFSRYTHSHHHSYRLVRPLIDDSFPSVIPPHGGYFHANEERFDQSF